MFAQAPRYDLLLKGGHVIDPANHIDEVRDVAVFQGKIAAIEKNIPADQAGKVVDVSKLYISPGLIDIHFHVGHGGDRKSTRLNSSHSQISYAVFCLKKKKKQSQSHVVSLST